ncbi:MAG TPA: multiheme c-type cytochrome [Allosphingosinicella sp.]|nr:multiheme c-type cytochrome [Allosphingosinicella sp.]
MPAFAGVALIALASPLSASEGEKPVARDYSRVRAAAAPRTQEWDSAEGKSAGCVSCHTDSDQKTMHSSPAVVLGCVDCHGGDPAVNGDSALPHGDPRYVAARDKAHVLPKYPKSWHWPSSANPKRSYTLLNQESPEFVRFVNPSDYRVARESCGACHIEVIEAAERSLMASGAMFWGGAAYNNGIVPYKNYMFGEAYTRHGEPAKIVSPPNPQSITPEQKARGVLAELYPLPTWHVVPPGDVFRVFERGGRTIGTQFPEIGLPSPSGSIQRLEESGRPDIRQSNRGPGTGLRVAIPVLNIHKTRLNDPFMWFMGTNDQPGDYRHSGCAGCHVVYANDREPRHSLTWAQFGRDGQTATADPTIRNKVEARHAPVDAAHGSLKEKGHPVRHAFTRAIPTAQCMSCHMHQPNIFLNSFLGYTMWDYEADADLMWPGPENRLPRSGAKEEQALGRQRYPNAAEALEILDRNPESAATRGLWGDLDFLREVYDRVNPLAKHTQFADYHGHGWNFRAVYKRDREGNLLDAGGGLVSPDDPEKFRKAGAAEFVAPGEQKGKAVHLMDIHAEKGMQCADCHFAQDSHGNGYIYGEVANAVEIGCKDCHGTATEYPKLLTSGPAAPPKGTNLALLRNEDGRRRFEWMVNDEGRRVLVQRSIVDPELEWEVSLVRDTVDPQGPGFNLKAARAKLMSSEGSDSGRYVFGSGVAPEKLAHKDDEMACFTCHLSWTTSCGGCHLPIEANWKTRSHKYDGAETRNFATYNPQVARDDMFQLGRHQTTKGNIIAPVRSSSALILSSTNINRERIYVQQPPISSAGFSSQAFAPHFPHTVRRTETKTCTDCHLSRENDNNAVMAQLLLQGTNFVNFVGLHAYVGLDGAFQATRVTEWDEPQAVIGSYLQRFAYPDWWRLHVDRNKRELTNWTRGGKGSREQFANLVQDTGGTVGCLQQRGEYMFVAEGKGGFRVYDVASVGNKAVSERIVTAPFSPLGHDTRVDSRNATCLALPTNQPISLGRNEAIRRDHPENQEQAFHPLYRYAVVTDAEEGLILVDVETLADGEPRNNFLKRAVTWNEAGVLDGARHVTLGGRYAYVAAKAGLVVVDLDDPLRPSHAATVPLRDARASALQFRYLWVTDAEGLKLLDVTRMESPRLVPSGTVPLADARRVYVARTYAYVAAKTDGLVIVDVTRPEAPRVHQRTTFGGRMTDSEDVIVASTSASLFAYVADGRAGLKVLQLTAPDTQPNFYGFSPAPMPDLIAWAKTPKPALALSKGLDRDRAVDETGGQIAVFGRLGSRPFTRAEMERLFLNRRGLPYKVSDAGGMEDWVQ